MPTFSTFQPSIFTCWEAYPLRIRAIDLRVLFVQKIHQTRIIFSPIISYRCVCILCNLHCSFVKTNSVYIIVRKSWGSLHPLLFAPNIDPSWPHFGFWSKSLCTILFRLIVYFLFVFFSCHLLHYFGLRDSDYTGILETHFSIRYAFRHFGMLWLVGPTVAVESRAQGPILDLLILAASPWFHKWHKWYVQKSLYRLLSRLLLWPALRPKLWNGLYNSITMSCSGRSRDRDVFSFAEYIEYNWIWWFFLLNQKSQGVTKLLKVQVASLVFGGMWNSFFRHTFHWHSKASLRSNKGMVERVSKIWVYSCPHYDSTS